MKKLFFIAMSIMFVISCTNTAQKENGKDVKDTKVTKDATEVKTVVPAPSMTSDATAVKTVTPAMTADATPTAPAPAAMVEAPKVEVKKEVAKVPAKKEVKKVTKKETKATKK